MSYFVKWAQKERSAGTQIVATLLAGVLLVVLLPLVMVLGGAALDRRLNLRRLRFGALSNTLGGFLVVVGLFFGWWSILAQLTRGRGTPLPLMPTQTLLTKAPYSYCRNPMTFGTILAYLGIGIAAGTISGIGFVVCFAGLLILYISQIEERELAERFGEPYLAYKRTVPFIIPKIPKQR